MPYKLTPIPPHILDKIQATFEWLTTLPKKKAIYCQCSSVHFQTVFRVRNARSNHRVLDVENVQKGHRLTSGESIYRITINGELEQPHTHVIKNKFIPQSIEESTIQVRLKGNYTEKDLPNIVEYLHSIKAVFLEPLSHPKTKI